MATPGGQMPQQQQPQQPSPQQIAMMQKKIAADAEKAGMTVPDYVAKMKAQFQAQQAAAQQQQQQAQQQQQQQPIQPGPPKPEALAVAKFLKSQDLKLRTVILNGQRKDMFKVKRATRALESPAYTKARAKNPLLPEITDRASVENTFKLLPLSLLALRVSKVDPEESAKKKRVKGLWTVKIEQQQECKDDLYFIWLWEGSQIKQKLYAAGALAIVFALVMFPLWPMVLRQGVWYLSMASIGLIGLFFAMAIFRLILFGITMFVTPPGLWLYPNLFEDVGFMDSFRPVWGWEEKKVKKKKKATAHSATSGGMGGVTNITGQVPAAQATTTAGGPQISAVPTERRYSAPRIEEVDDDE